MTHPLHFPERAAEAIMEMPFRALMDLAIHLEEATRGHTTYNSRQRALAESLVSWADKIQEEADDEEVKRVAEAV